MKNKPLIYTTLFAGLLSAFLFSCKKETPQGAPAIVSTTVISKITPLSASAASVIISDEGAPVTLRGFCWGTTVSPDINDNKSSDSTGIGDFTSKLTGLTPGINYYVRAYARSSAGISYGEEVSFTATPPPQFNSGLTYGTMTDVEGNVYKTIQIGTQIWMAENLKTTRYRNGDAIPNVTANNQWAALTTGAYCNYDNNEEYAVVYGRLYNGYAVSDSRNLAPAGWHIPTASEWSALKTFLGIDAGTKLMEAGSLHYRIQITGTNASGFTAIPGGDRGAEVAHGNFHNLDATINFWLSNQNGASQMNYINVRPESNYISSITMGYAFNVRCVKD